MKYFILFTIIFSIISETQTQNPQRPYEKLQFINNNPVWYETIFDSTLINTESDGYNSLFTSPISPLIKDSFIYTIAEILTTSNYNEGALIEKRNINNGLLVWKITYDLKSIEFNEIPFKMYLGEDGYLYVHGFRKTNNELSSYPFLFFYQNNCRLTYRKIDPENGSVLELFTPEDNDIDAIRVLASINKRTHFSDICVLQEDSSFLYWERIVDNSNHPIHKIHFQKFNKYGNILSERDSIILKGPYNGTINLMPVNEDSIIFINFNTESQEIKGYFYDTDFKFLDSVAFTKAPYYFEHSNFVENHQNAFFIKSYDVIDINNHQFSGAIYDKNGNLLDFVSIKTDIENIYLLYYDEIRNKIIITESGYLKNPLKSYISFYSSTGNGTYNLTSTLNIMDSLRSGGIFHMLFLPEEKILCYLTEASLYINSNLYLQDFQARAQSLMLFNASDIGLATVSTNETGSASFSTSLYPNPATDEINVRFSAKINGQGQITDGQGRILREFDVQDEDEINVPCSQLVPGLYFFRLYNQYGHIQTVRFVRM